MRVIIIITVTTYILTICFYKSDEIFRLNFINVGQGDAILLQNKKNTVLIDGGEGYEAEKEIEKIINTYIRGTCIIDLIFVTHPHADHLEGINRVLRRCKTKTAIYNDVSVTSHMFDEFKDNIRNLNILNPTSGQEIKVGEVRLIILWPPAEYPQPENINNISTVILMDVGDLEVLFTGDAEEEVWKQLDYELLFEYLDPPLEIFKSPHHGAINGLHKESLKEMSPRYCVISVGEDNKFGHPSPEVVEFYNEIGCKIYRTDIHGNVVFTIKEP